MNTAGGEQRARIASVTLAIATLALSVLLIPAPAEALCGDAESPEFTLNTLTAGDHVGVVVIDAFNELPVRNAYVKILKWPELGDPVAQGAVPATGAYEANLLPGTYVAWANQPAQIPPEPEGYHAGFSEPFECTGSGTSSERIVRLRTKTVVLVHGWTGNTDSWEDEETTNWKATLEAAGHQVKVPAMPGNDFVGGTESIDKQAEFLTHQIESYGVESVYIVAHSLGGLVSRSCSEGPLKDKVVRVFALATPNHGTPLADSVGGAVVIVRSFANQWHVNPFLTGLRLLARLHKTFGAVRDAVPNSQAMRILNQGDEDAEDWKGSCKDPPNDELFVESNVQYCTIAATKTASGILDAFHWTTFGDELLKRSSCYVSDGLVPWASAPLWADGDVNNDPKVRNYLDIAIGDGSHHLGRGPVAIVKDPAIRNFVIDWLEEPELPPSHWIPADAFPDERCAGCDRQERWATLPLIEGEIEGAASIIETLAVEPTDSLSVLFSWFEGSVFMSVEDPQGALVDTSCAIIDRDHGLVLYHIAAPQPGSWTLHIDSQAGTQLQGYCLVPYVMSDTMLDVETSPPNLRPGQPLTIRATASSAGVGVPGATVTAAVLGPLGSEDELTLYDDGIHDDGAPNDGIYGAAYTAMSEGSYVGSVDMTLATRGEAARDPISRQAFAAFAAVDSLDLAVVPESTQVVESTQFVDMPCHIVTAVTNLGLAVCDSVRVLVDLEGASAMLADTLFMLAPGQTEQLEVQLMPAAACTHVVHVRVRAADGRVDENSDNDEVTITFLPQVGVPNLTIDSVDLSNPNPAPGEEITADIVVLCNNTARSTGTFVDVYYDLDQPPVVGQRGDQQIYIQPLLPGESFTLTSQPFSYGSDDYFSLYFQVDPEDRCAEADEDDNVCSTSVVTSVDDAGTAFAASAVNGRALLQWMAPALDGVTGFNICRSMSQAGPFSSVNSEPIPLCSMCEYEDVTVLPGQEYWYELRGILPGGGEVVLGGPVSIEIDGVLAFGLAAGRPNPTSQETWFALDLPSDCADVRLEIYDVSGRLVRVVTEGPDTRGRHILRWDLVDASGHPVAAGVYFAKASAADWTGTRKVVVIR